VLQKRENYRKLFANFDFQKIVQFTDEQLETILQNSGIIRNRLKVYSVRINAEKFIEVRDEFGSFSNYLWGFVEKPPIINTFKSLSELPASTPLSDEIAKGLKKRGFKFIGSTIVYAYLQAVGVVNDHTTDCAWHAKI
jgi:DNA-3-methyladenine glycosylase I